jgi:hypothetical protein
MKNKLILLVILILAFTPIANVFAATASLYLSPSSRSYNVGEAFSVSVYVSSTEVSMNAAAGSITFPTDKLEVTSLNKAGSVMSLWVQEPSYSNGSGIVNFEGIVLNPGYKGSGGKLIAINFRAKSAGVANVSFSSGSILANDGMGTNILSGLGSADYTIGVTESEPEPEPTPEPEPASDPTPDIDESVDPTPEPSASVNLPFAPTVISSTHPDQEKWYKDSDPAFSWSIPSGITGVNVLADQNKYSNPGTSSDGMIRQQTYSNVEDGVWYFHIRFRNSEGWGPVTHYKFQIDTVEPEFLTITEFDREDSTIQQVPFIFDADDLGSGLDHYEMQVDNGVFIPWHNDGVHTYETPLLSAGGHSLFVKVFDRAGNFVGALADFTIEAVQTPVITSVPSLLEVGDLLVVKGDAIPNIEIDMWVQKGEDIQIYKTETDNYGNFKIIIDDRLKAGNYTIWTQATNQFGAKSDMSAKVSVEIKRTSMFDFATWPKSFMISIIILLIIIVGQAIFLWRSIHKLAKYKFSVQNELKDVQVVMGDAFQKLKADMKNQIGSMQKAKTKAEREAEEDRIMKNLSRKIRNTEKEIWSEADDIEDVNDAFS